MVSLIYVLSQKNPYLQHQGEILQSSPYAREVTNENNAEVSAL
jgi:hypothetical protein